jgi:hypothetical protein
MANALYDRGRESFLRGELAWQTHEFRVILIDAAGTSDRNWCVDNATV